jgi:carbonic anhydrase
MYIEKDYCTVTNMTAQVALQELKVGNERYTLEHLEHPHEGAKRRIEVSTAQHPFAIILGCADSRVIPELIFDQGVGDLFVVRLAGNIADDAVIASIEYAIEHLGSRLVVVLGHENCGAVKAVIDHETSDGKINSLVDYIEPALELAQRQTGQLLTNTIKSHTRRMTEVLRTDEPILAHETKVGNVMILPAYYHLDTGKVDFLDEC